MSIRGARGRIYPSYRVRSPKFVGGALALDFVNTLEWRGRPQRGDRLVNYDELLIWAECAGAVDRKTRTRLSAIAMAHPEKAAAVLADAVALREAAAELLGARARRPSLVDRVNAWLDRAPARIRIAPLPQGYRWVADGKGVALEAPLWPVVWSAADLLTSGRVASVRACANRHCGWMFLDSSRNRRRRWCSMEGCGNRAKARRHYRRQRAG